MKLINKRDLINVIDKSAEELHQRIDMQRYLMATIIEKRVGDVKLNRILLSCSSSNESRLKEAIKEAIDVLEETRKAFKSTKWAALRKKLTHVLIESK